MRCEGIEMSLSPTTGSILMKASVPHEVLVLAHTGREEAIRAAQALIIGLTDAGLRVSMQSDEASDIPGAVGRVYVADSIDAAMGDADLVIVVGGDGTILRAAELARRDDIPLLGINLGHVGFLAESEREDVSDVVHRVASADYSVEQRMTIDVRVTLDGELLGETFALNEASVERLARQRMLELAVEIDGRPVTTFGCDGVVMATPTGSTAYAFSAGGPVVWPEVEALLMVPLSAHALFSRPLVVSPDSVVAVELLAGTPAGFVVCDGRRGIDLPPGARVEVTRGKQPVRLARLATGPFTDRLVAKFRLPVTGWRGPAVASPTDG